MEREAIDAMWKVMKVIIPDPETVKAIRGMVDTCVESTVADLNDNHPEIDNLHAGIWLGCSALIDTIRAISGTMKDLTQAGKLSLNTAAHLQCVLVTVVCMELEDHPDNPNKASSLASTLSTTEEKDPWS